MAVLFLIVFLDLVGFGLVIPLLPFYVQRVGVGPEVITAVLGLYSLAQFVAAPVWGRLSDRHGRKPILVITSFGYTLSFLMLAYADNLWLLVASRVFGGLMAGNLAAAQAYVSDVTTLENRAKGMGLIGAAFGLGFVFGPAFGGLLGGADPATADYTTPALAAAALTLVATLGAALFLKESLPAKRRAPSERGYLRLDIITARPRLALLILAGFLVIGGWAQFETVFGLWAYAVLDYGPRQVGFVMTFMAVMSAAVQGGGVGALVRRAGETMVATAGLILLALGYVLLTAAAALTPTLIAAALLGVGSACFTPSISSLISKQAGAGDQGVALGAYQSATALARFAGPAVSGSLYARLGHNSPFVFAAVLLLPALLLLHAKVRPPAV